MRCAPWSTPTPLAGPPGDRSAATLQYWRRHHGNQKEGNQEGSQESDEEIFGAQGCTQERQRKEEDHSQDHEEGSKKDHEKGCKEAQVVS